MGRKLEAGRKDGCRPARSTAGRWYSQPICTELVTSKKSKTGCGMTVSGFGSSDIGRGYGHVVPAEEPTASHKFPFFWGNYTFTASVLSSETTL